MAAREQTNGNSVDDHQDDETEAVLSALIDAAKHRFGDRRWRSHVAVETRVTEQAVRQYERRERTKLPFGVAYRWAKAVGVSLDTLRPIDRTAQSNAPAEDRVAEPVPDYLRRDELAEIIEETARRTSAATVEALQTPAVQVQMEKLVVGQFDSAVTRSSTTSSSDQT